MTYIYKKSLVIYELNEIPKRVLENFVYKNPKSNLAKLYNNKGFSETFTNDSGELHPWSSWPTFHRGVNSQTHNLKFLNQDITVAKKFPTIWEKLNDKGFSIGIFGSLQSFPPISGENVKFYLPDTFAPSPDAYPHFLEDFQSFNLSLTMRNKAHSRSIKFKDFRKFTNLFLSGSFSFKTLYIIFKHVFLEIFYKKYKTRRSLLQPILGFDIYINLLKKHNPQFSTFFSNHVAGVMHRYWKDSFPEDFSKYKEKNIRDTFNESSLELAVKIADYQIGLLLDFQNKRGGKFWVVSALGQEAVNWGDYVPEITIESENNLLKMIGLKKTLYKFVPSMHPDINIKCKDKESLHDLRRCFFSLTDINNRKLFTERYEPVNNTINFTLNSSKVLCKTKKVKFCSSIFNLSQFGLGFVDRDQGTGYHCPKGIFISNSPSDINSLRSTDSECIDTTCFHEFIYDYFLND